MFTLPRLANAQDQTRSADLETLAGAIRNAAALAHATWRAQGALSGTGITIQINGQNVVLDAGFPQPGEIAKAVQGDLAQNGFVELPPGSGSFAHEHAQHRAACRVTYTGGSPPSITVVDDDCS